MADMHLLDNPIWNSLNTTHAALALVSGLARRYPAAIGPLSGLADQSDAAYEDLRTLAGPEGIVVLFLQEPYKPRAGWTLRPRRPADADDLHAARRCKRQLPLPAVARMRRLTAADAPAMVRARHPHRARSLPRAHARAGIIRPASSRGQRLVSMAGQRTRSPGFVEVSAVCTHPDARGKGYARTLMLAVMDEIRCEGNTPYLHAWADNYNAIRVYRDLGYTHRHTLYVAALRNDA